MAQVAATLSDDTKANWEQFVDESDYGSMSELIRVAVRKEIRGGGNVGGETNVPRELARRIDEINETQKTLSRRMESLGEDFEDVAESVGEEQYPPEVVDVAHEIAGELTEIGEEEFAEKQEAARMEATKIAREHFPDDDRVGAGMIGEALEYLEENLGYVRVVGPAPSEYYRVRGR